MSLKTHNILDYVGGAAIAILSGMFDVAAARNLFLFVGLGVIVYSLITNYRYSLFKWLPLSLHMALDVAGGIVLALGPWLFGYRDQLTGGQTGLHVALGLGLVALVLFTPKRMRTQGAVTARARREERELVTPGRR